MADSVLAHYPGSYAVGTLTIAVRADSGRLLAQATGQDPFPLTAIGPRMFEYVPAGILIEFAEPVRAASPQFTLFQQQSALVLAQRDTAASLTTPVPRP